MFIIDDSLFSRNRSKKVELLAKVFDHAHHEYVYGFRMLTLGWSDGNTFLPVSHCLLSTENAKNRKAEASAAIDPRTNGGRQRKLAQQKCTDVAWKLLKEAAEAGIPAKHVLFDTWFCSPSALIKIKQGIHLDAIAMTKKSSKMRYRYQGKMQSVMDSPVAFANQAYKGVICSYTKKNGRHRNPFHILEKTQDKVAKSEIKRLVPMIQECQNRIDTLFNDIPLLSSTQIAFYQKILRERTEKALIPIYEKQVLHKTNSRGGR